MEVLCMGPTENTGLELNGRSISREWKMQDWNYYTDQFAGVENTGLELNGPKMKTAMW